MSWLSCCCTAGGGNSVSGRDAEGLADGSGGRGCAPNPERTGVPQRCLWITQFWQQLLLISLLISVGSQPPRKDWVTEQTTATAAGTLGWWPLQLSPCDLLLKKLCRLLFQRQGRGFAFVSDWCREMLTPILPGLAPSRASASWLWLWAARGPGRPWGWAPWHLQPRPAPATPGGVRPWKPQMTLFAAFSPTLWLKPLWAHCARLANHCIVSSV